jgi:hypothetical protein
MNKTKTLWADPAKKFKPRNKQAALICAKPKGIHMPPPEPTLNVIDQRKLEAKRIQERAAKAAAEIEAAKLAEKEAAKAAAKKQQEEKRNRAKSIKPDQFKNMWMAKSLKRQARSAGKPKPSTADIRDTRKNLYTSGSL